LNVAAFCSPEIPCQVQEVEQMSGETFIFHTL
jgi:hypothetical protein